MRNTRKKGGVRLRLRTKPMQTDSVVFARHDNTTRKKNGTSRSGVVKTSSKKKSALDGVRNAIEKHIKIDIEQPKFESLFAGQLYKFFYRDENGPYQLFKKLKNTHGGRCIHIDNFTNLDYSNIIGELEENITKLDKDLKHFKESVSKISKIEIPKPIDDDLSKLFGLTSINEQKE